MPLARRLLALTGVALTALALTAGTASAQLEVHSETGTDPCGDVTIDGHVVTGGCHVDFASTGDGVAMHTYIPSKVTVFTCEWYIEGQIGENGEGHVTEVVLEEPHGGGGLCRRVACDEAAPSHEMFPWPFHIREVGAADEEIQLAFCLRNIDTEEGATGLICEVHLEFTDLGGHQYEIGHATETFCENNPPTNPTSHPTLPSPSSIEAHLISAPSGETFEVVH